MPFITDLSQDKLTKIEQFTLLGGKIIVVFPELYDSIAVNNLAALSGVKLSASKKTTSSHSINIIEGKQPNDTLMPASVKLPDMLLLQGTKSFAVWGQAEENLPAITISEKGSYIGWRWGIDGSLELNSAVLRKLIYNLAPEITLQFLF